MASRSDPHHFGNAEREARSQRAFDHFKEWALREGMQPVLIPLYTREAALIVAILAHHAVEVNEQGGNSALLLAIAEHLAQELEQVLGPDQTTRVIHLCGTMMTGLE